MRQAEVTPHLYAEIFEADRRGAAVLEHLIQRYMHPPSRPASHDGMRIMIEAAEFSARRSVIDYIINQINRAHDIDPGLIEDEQA